VLNGKARASGQVLYPGSARLSASGYPTWLLDVAERGLQPGCPPAPLPRGILGTGSPLGGVSSIDASRAELDATEAELARALISEPAAGCRPP